MRVNCLAAALAAIGLLVACSEPTQSPTVAHPSYAIGEPASCPAAPDFTVRSEEELAAALSAAQPGDVIAVDGFFEVGDAIIRTDDVTLTCFTPGSGLRGRGDLGLIVKVVARRVTVSDLVLDATNSVEGAYLAFFNGTTDFGEDIQFLRNTVTCGATNKCVFFGSELHAGAHGGLVADNHITVAGGKFGGVTVQGVDGGRVERNTIVATAPSTDGIRANGDERIVVSDNVVSGPWSVSLHFLDGVFQSVVEGNRLEGARDDAADLFFVDGLRFVANEVTCGPGACVFMISGPGALIADNHFESSGSFTGVHLQDGIDGVRVEGNTVVATAPSTGADFGGIRARGGADVVIAGNVVLGPWANSIALTDLANGRIEHNRLDGASGDAADLLGSQDVQFLSNTVGCGGGACLVADGSPGALIADNHFESAGSGTGVHLQNGTSGDRIERNTILATAPSGAPAFGAIRVRDGSDVLVADDTVLGPWSNSVAPAQLSDSRFERNELRGAAGYGIHLSTYVVAVPAPITNTVFRNNRITGAGNAGILAQIACANQFVGNNLQGNAGNIGAIFDATTGANVLVGNHTVVIDDGAFDCNGDGVTDRNIITGPGRVLRGAPFTAPANVRAGTSSRLR